MGRRAIFLWIGGAFVAYWAVMTVIDWRLTRGAEGASCEAFTRDDLIGEGYDFAPRTSFEKQLHPAQVRTARSQPYPDCTISQASYRCHQIGPAMVQVSHYGKYQYFDVPEGKMAVLYGREGWANCVLRPASEAGDG